MENKIVFTCGGIVKFATVTSKVGNMLYGRLFTYGPSKASMKRSYHHSKEVVALTTDARPYTYSNVKLAYADLVEMTEYRALNAFAAFPDEIRLDDRHDGANAQLEVTDREYRPVSIHAA